MTCSVPTRSAGALLGAVLGLLTWIASLSPSLQAGPLEDYVHRTDRSFNWKRTEQKKTKAGLLTHLEFVSQTWRGQFWSHHLMVIRPETVRNPSIALLFITGGSYNAPDEKELEMFNIVAQRAGALVAIINKVPNQPLYDGRHEDALIAYTFDQYLKTGDKTWPLLLPMVKSAVRGMDVVQAFAKTEFKQQIEHFVVSGASKRGWTTWLTAAADPRVTAIAPMVIDMLNMRQQLAWADKVYGKQSEEINDYTAINLHLRQDEPVMGKLRRIVDPYSYRARYTMPKLLLLGTNDPYWTVDSLRHYWGDLPGPKLVFQTPNAGHDLAGGKEAVQTLAAWFQMIADGQELPRLEWNFQEAAGAVQASVSSTQPARKITLWTADSKDRDFRDDKWTSRELLTQPGAVHAVTSIPTPEQGYRAYLCEVTVVSPTGDEYRLSTAARVTPDNIK